MRISDWSSDVCSSDLDIDRWVTMRALKMQAKRDGAQHASSLFVKLSEDTLKDSENFVPWLQVQLKKRPLRPGELVFAAQERVLQNHIRKAKIGRAHV